MHVDGVSHIVDTMLGRCGLAHFFIVHETTRGHDDNVLCLLVWMIILSCVLLSLNIVDKCYVFDFAHGQEEVEDGADLVQAKVVYFHEVRGD